MQRRDHWMSFQDEEFSIGADFRGAGASLPGFWGVPKPSFPFLAAASGAQKRRKKVFRGHPDPRQRADRPLQSRFRGLSPRLWGTPPAGRTLHPAFWDRFQIFGMTHNR